MLLVRDIAQSGHPRAVPIELCASSGLAWRTARALDTAVSSGGSASTLLLPLIELMVSVLQSAAAPPPQSRPGSGPERVRPRTAKDRVKLTLPIKPAAGKLFELVDLGDGATLALP